MSHAARMAALRKEMNTFDVDGFIIPRSDEHQGEYVAPSADRLKWISGFTGSAGYAIVLKDVGAIFIDGRYTVQVTKEVDGQLFEYRHVSNDPVEDWLRVHFKEGMRLAYDPWLHTEPQLKRYKKICEELKGTIVPAPHNFIDAVWKDRPEAPCEKIYPHPLSYSGKHHNDKMDDVVALLKKEKQEAAFFSLPDTIAWLFNIRGGDLPYTPVGLCFALLYQDGHAEIFVDPKKIDKETRTHLGERVHLFTPQQLGEQLDLLSEKLVRVDGVSCPKWVLNRLKSTKAELSIAEDPCQLPKACKNGVEIEGMRKAHYRDGVAMVRFLSWLSRQPYDEAVNELAVSDKLDGLRLSHELCRDLSFPTISGAGENGAIVHYRVTESTSIPLPENGLYLVDSGAQYVDGTTDITRTIVRGTPTEEMKEAFTRVLKGHIALSSVQFPKGTTGSQLDVLARQYLWQVGLDYDHGTGHGVGSFLNVHEGPQRISKMPSTVPLEVGMVISNEPGFYKTGSYGIRIENLICVQPVSEQKGEREMFCFEELTVCPIDRTAIALELLSQQEVDWLNRYHQKVREIVYDQLEGEEEKSWLVAATAAL